MDSQQFYFILSIIFGASSFIITLLTGTIGYLIKCSIDRLNHTVEGLVEASDQLNGRMLAIEYRTSDCPHVMEHKEGCDGTKH